MRKPDVLTLFDYHYWANRQILRAAAQLRDEQFSAPLEVTVRNLQDTLVHQLDVEWSWRLRLQGEPPEVWQQQELEAADFPTVASLAERWKVDEREMRAYLESLSDADLEAEAAPDRYPLWYYLMHIYQHSAQSRADAATILTNLGHSPGHIDFLDFADTLDTI
jgi:uncharacterized damage-inducible protein DinB